MASHTATTKEQARALLENLPDDATWDDIVYELAARRSIELGLASRGGSRMQLRRAVSFASGREGRFHGARCFSPSSNPGVHRD